MKEVDRLTRNPEIRPGSRAGRKIWNTISRSERQSTRALSRIWGSSPTVRPTVWRKVGQKMPRMITRAEAERKEGIRAMR